MKIWFKNFLKSFYSPNAIIDMKYVKWYWNLLYLFTLTLTFAGIFILFFTLNSWNMTRMIGLGTNTPNAYITQNGKLQYHDKLKGKDEDGQEIELDNILSFSYFADKIKVEFIEDENNLKSFKSYLWYTQNFVIENEINIEKNIKDEITKRFKYFLSANEKFKINNDDFKFYLQTSQEIQPNQIKHNNDYYFKLKNMEDQFKFRVVKNQNEIDIKAQNNVFIFNKTSLIFTIATHNDYFTKVPYFDVTNNDSIMADLNFKDKNDWRKVLNFMFDITKFEWLPFTFLALYLTIIAYVFIFIILFGSILWIMTIGAKRRLKWFECISVISYCINLPAIIAIIVPIFAGFNILISFLIIAIGSLLFVFLVIFIWFRGGSLKDKYKQVL